MKECSRSETDYHIPSVHSVGGLSLVMSVPSTNIALAEDSLAVLAKVRQPLLVLVPDMEPLARGGSELVRRPSHRLRRLILEAE